MANNIDILISNESLENLRKLDELLKANVKDMESLVQSSIDLNNSLRQSSNVKDTVKLIEEQNNVTKKLNDTNLDRLKIEREIKTEGDKMAKAVNEQTQSLNGAMQAYRNMSLSTKEMTNEIARLKIATEANKKQQSDLKKLYKDGAISIDEYNAKLALLYEKETKLSQSLGKMQSDYKNITKAMSSSQGSMDAISQTLSLLKRRYAELSEYEREGLMGTELKKNINELDEAIKGLDKSIGNNQRNVGNYEVASENLKSVFRGIREELQNTTFQYRQYSKEIEAQKNLVAGLDSNSDRYAEESAKLQEMTTHYKELNDTMQTLQEKASEMADVIGDTNKAIQSGATDTQILTGISEGAQAMADAFTVAQGAAQLLGLSTESLMNTFAKIQVIQSLAKSVKKLGDFFTGNNVIMTKARGILANMKTAYLEASAASTAAATANKGFSLSIKGIGAAIKSVPIVGWILGVVAAVGALVTAIAKLNKQRREDNAKEWLKSLEEQRSKTVSLNAEQQVQINLAEKLAAKLKTLKPGTTEYNNVADKLAKILGVSADEIKRNTNNLDDYIAKLRESIMIEANLAISKERLIELYKKQADRQDAMNDLKDLPSKKSYDYGIGYFNDLGFKEAFEKAKVLFDKYGKELSRDEFIDKYWKVSFSNKGQAMQNLLNLLGLPDPKDDINKEIDKIYNLSISTHTASTSTTTSTKPSTKPSSTSSTTEYKPEYQKEDVDAMLKESNVALNSLFETELEYIERVRKEQLAALDAEEQEFLSHTEYTEEERVKIQQTYTNKRNAVNVKYGNDLQAYNDRLADDEKRKAEENYNEEVKRIQNEYELKKLNYTSAYDLKLLEIEQMEKELALLSEKGELIEEEAHQYELLAKKIALAKGEAEQLKQAQSIEDAKFYLQTIGDTANAFGELANAVFEANGDQVKAAKAQAAMSISQAAISGALALAQAPNLAAQAASIAGPAAPIVYAATLASVIASITAAIIKAKKSIQDAKQSVASASAYAKGTEYHRGGLAVVGEGKSGNGYRPELVQEPSGKSYVISQPTLLTDLPIGSKVIPLKKGEFRGVKNINNAQYFNGNAVNLANVEGLLSSINSKPSVSVNLNTRGGMDALIKKSNLRNKIINKRFKV